MAAPGELLPSGEETSEEHSQSYVTKERRSQKAEEPRPEGLRLFWAAPLLLVSHRPSGMLLPRASVQPKIDLNAALPYFASTA
jgi:hypothetical protein